MFAIRESPLSTRPCFRDDHLYQLPTSRYSKLSGIHGGKGYGTYGTVTVLLVHADMDAFRQHCWLLQAGCGRGQGEVTDQTECFDCKGVPG